MNFFITTDIVVICREKRRHKILLIRRKNDPFKGMWALPGGFVEKDEEIIDAAKRELYEETGIKIRTKLHEIGVFGKVGRDPRGRTISIAYLALINKVVHPKASTDAKEAQWFSIKNLPPLAFDHKEIIRKAMKLFKKNYEL